MKTIIVAAKVTRSEFIKEAESVCCKNKALWSNSKGLINLQSIFWNITNNGFEDAHNLDDLDYWSIPGYTNASLPLFLWSKEVNLYPEYQEINGTTVMLFCIWDHYGYPTYMYLYLNKDKKFRLYFPKIGNTTVPGKYGYGWLRTSYHSIPDWAEDFSWIEEMINEKKLTSEIMLALNVYSNYIASTAMPDGMKAEFREYLKVIGSKEDEPILGKDELEYYKEEDAKRYRYDPRARVVQVKKEIENKTNIDRGNRRPLIFLHPQ